MEYSDLGLSNDTLAAGLSFAEPIKNNDELPTQIYPLDQTLSSKKFCFRRVCFNVPTLSPSQSRFSNFLAEQVAAPGTLHNFLHTNFLWFCILIALLLLPALRDKATGLLAPEQSTEMHARTEAAGRQPKTKLGRLPRATALLTGPDHDVFEACLWAFVCF